MSSRTTSCDLTFSRCWCTMDNSHRDIYNVPLQWQGMCVIANRSNNTNSTQLISLRMACYLSLFETKISTSQWSEILHWGRSHWQLFRLLETSVFRVHWIHWQIYSWKSQGEHQWLHSGLACCIHRIPPTISEPVDNSMVGLVDSSRGGVARG